MPTLTSCPTCARQLRVPDYLLGKPVKCPACQTTFTATADTSVAPPLPEPVPLTPDDAFAPPPAGDPFANMSEPRGGDPRGGFDLRDTYPRSESRYDREFPGRGEARQRVGGPALALLIVKGIGMFFLCLGFVGGMAAATGGRGNEANAGVVRVVITVVAMIFDAVIIFGALQMKDLSSYGWAMTASVMAVIPFGGCCILSIPFGIWSLVVLNDPEVRRAFR